MKRHYLNALLVGLTVCCLVVLCSSSAQAQTTLQYKFTKGQELKYEMKMDFTFQATAYKLTLEWIAEASLLVNSTDASGDGKLECHLKRIRFLYGVTTGAGTSKVLVGYDTKGDKDIVPGKGKPSGGLSESLRDAKNMLNKPASLTIGNRGRIKNVSFSKELLKTLQSRKSFPQLEQLKKYSGLYALIQVPASPAKKGESWSREFTNDQNKKFKVYYTYQGKEKLDGRELDRIALRVEGNLIAPEKTGSGTKTIVKKTSGVMKLDAKEGTLQQLVIELDGVQTNQITKMSSKICLRLALQLQK